MIQLPDLFERKLSTAPELDSAVRQNFKLFEPWLEQSGMPFFPGFTDHSPRHINDVLSTAASLISDASHDLLSAEDVAVLCMSILLHDSGMHLTRDSFRVLVSDFTPPIISGLGDLPWTQLWEDFLSEARRFGQDQLTAIFGDPDAVRIGELNLENLSELDDLLVGEFVRRHHSRLAHEIAMTGVPTAKSKDPLELTGLDAELRDLAGLIGRSHGMPIRAAFPYIENKYSLLPEYRGVKTPYLMAVLRIADYVQVKSERALKSLLSVKELRSPISRQEWRNHFAVKDVSQRHDDPEALFVNAKPCDVRTYLKLESLFRDIQRELDESWATIGEVYGRQSDLSRLGLTWRRIRSNLDEKDRFSRTVPYIPIRAGFDASGPDLLKLLVGPLYNYEYKIGIRELVQNAVDACKELIDLPSHSGVDLVPSEMPDVLVEIHENSDGTGWITVSDKGVGMTVDTITRYFLVAGASFRNSDVWKQQHMNESGQIRVMRGGRFGVGALAAFLLGEEIAVQTRHAGRSEENGLEFKARIDDPVVELRRCTAPIGTSIKIWVANPSVINSLRPHKYFLEIPGDDEEFKLDSWPEVDWFVQSQPRVVYRWNGYSQPLRQDPDEVRVRFRGEFQTSSDELVPLPQSPDVKWHALPEPHPYKAIFWKYRQSSKAKNEDQEEIRRSPDEVTVNGIRVEKLYGGRSRYVESPRVAIGDGPEYWLSRPSLAIFDPTGVCPINLQRSAVSFERMGFDEQLSQALLREHLMQLPRLSKGCNNLARFKKLCSDVQAMPDVHYQGQVLPFCATLKGIFLATPKCFSELKIKILWLIDTADLAKSSQFSSLLKEGEALLLRTSKSGIQNDLAWFRGVLAEDDGYDWYRRNSGFPNLERSAAVFAMRPQLWELANQEGKVKRQILTSLRDVPHILEHKVVMSGDTNDANKLVQRASDLLAVLGETSEIGAWKLTYKQPLSKGVPIIHNVWTEIFGGPYVRN